MNVDTAASYTVVTPTRYDRVESDITRLEATVSTIGADARHANADIQSLRTQGLVLAIVLVAVLVVYGLANARRRRETTRNLSMVSDLTTRLDAQEVRIAGIVDELAEERVRLHAAVNEVQMVGDTLRTDLAAGVDRLNEAAVRYETSLHQSSQTVEALVVQLQRAAQGAGSVQA